MLSLQDMSPADRAYMARHCPRTYRKMKGVTPDPQGHQQRRRSKLSGCWSVRHREVRAQRLLAIPKRCRTAGQYQRVFKRIKREISKHIDWAELRADDRHPEPVRFRQAAAWLLLKYTHLNLPKSASCSTGITPRSSMLVTK